MQITNISRKKRMKNMLVVSSIIFLLLISRVGFIQFVQGQELEAKAYMQQTLNRAINPKRGTIYDVTGKLVLAVSSTVETVTVTPMNIKKEDKEKVSRALSEIFSLDYETVFKKVSKRSSIETIVKKQDKEKTDELRNWMKDNNVNVGINIDEDTKRYYPFRDLASHIIGFCGSDNQGLDGVEAVFDDVLKGEKGSIAKVTDAKGGEIKEEGENYKSATDGKDIVLSIDMTVQSIAEKYLKQACIDNKCTDGGNVVAMNPKTGDILAMVTYPEYDLNNPFQPNTEELTSIWEGMSSKERNEAMQKMWRNKALADTYEPGSTFKLVTASAALEEGITTTDKEGEFACTGGIEVAGVRIKCWRYYRPHGSESLRQALMNSCNPVFIGLGQKMGVETYFTYLEKFGLLAKTNVDLPGEAGSIFIAKNKAGPVELATISFGQRFKITPLQMVRTVSAIANGGELVKPRIVKQMIDSTTGEIEEVPVEKMGRAISEETSKSVLSMMETVVQEGTGKNAGVKGYRIGGKTGTSEDGVNTNKYVASFIGVAPIEDPEIVMLVTLYNPTGEGGHQGGGVAAPVGGQIFSEVLPYLEVSKQESEEEQKNAVEVPEVRGLNLKDAEKTLKDVGLEMNYETQNEIDKEQTIIKEQMPKPGLKVMSGSKIEVYINDIISISINILQDNLSTSSLKEETVLYTIL